MEVVARRVHKGPGMRIENIMKRQRNLFMFNLLGTVALLGTTLTSFFAMM
jgi:hypothetical protein